MQVFVTSLITNLLAPGRGSDTLPLLHQRLAGQAAGSGAPSRLRSVRLVPPGSSETPVFDHARNLAALTAAAPNWPPRTDDLTETAIELVLDREGTFWKHLGPERLRLEILDYPGEWLVDLPMMDQSFQVWSVSLIPIEDGCQYHDLAIEVSALPRIARIFAAGISTIQQDVSRKEAGQWEVCHLEGGGSSWAPSAATSRPE